MDNKTPIIVALIGLIGTITVALITNWHNMFPAPVDRPATPATQPAAMPAPSAPLPEPAETASSKPAPEATAGSTAPSASPTQTTAAASPGPASNETASPAVKRAAGPASIGGQWEDADDDYRYVFTQSGAAFRYSASERGQDRGGGAGTIVGSVLIYNFQSSDGPGNCRAAIATDGKTISGSCARGDATFRVRLRRPVTLLPLDALVRGDRP